MKKIVLLLMATLMFAFHTNAQKSGILKKDNYFAFTGDQWEEFLAGKNSGEFEKKANVKLADYLKVVETFVKDKLGEASIASAVANSIVVNFPAGTDIYTMTEDGSWITRKSYPGEKGFQHSGGLCWLSFACGNLCNTDFNKTKPGYTPPGNTGTLVNNINPPNGGINISVNGQPQGAQDIQWRTGKSIYDEGRMDNRMAMYDAMLMEQMQSKILIEMQNSKQCCGGGSANIAVQPAVYQQPTLYTTTNAVAQPPAVDLAPKTTFGQSFGGQVLANFIGGTAANVAGTYIVRGIDRLTQRRVVYRYNNNNQLIGQYFEDSNQLDTGTTTGDGNNQWPTSGSGLSSGVSYANAAAAGYTKPLPVPVSTRIRLIGEPY